MAERMEDSENSKESAVARPYQLELLDAALNDDTIVNLGTGAGKTFIAVMLIKELSHDILRPFNEQGAKRTFFLVTTVPLVDQQASYIRRHTGLAVGQFTGAQGVDSWSKHRWQQELNNFNVLVMTMTIFRNLLQTSYLQLSQVNLVVFDECHHAVKNHDYVQIMRLFKPHIESHDITVPRRLGLTASLIPSKCKPGDIEKKIKELEQILVCRSQTAKDLQEVSKYATNPEEEECVYPPSSADHDIAALKSLLEPCVNFLELFKREDKDGGTYELIKMYLDDCLHILINLGIWCAYEFAGESVCVLEEYTHVRYDNDWERALTCLGYTQLRRFVEKSITVIQKRDDHIPPTPKVRCLLTYLGDSAVKSGEHGDEPSSSRESKLRGIIFVERRTTAIKLAELIQQKSKTDSDLSHINCDYVVGHNEGRKGTHLRREARMNTNKQNMVLERFRSGRVNLLVATSVVEEGVDIPKCNLVIRFDFPPNFRSYIQSKGRARAKVSRYSLFIEEGEERERRRADLQDYHALEIELQSICRGRGVPGEEDVLKRMEELVEPYMPYGKEGAVATLGSSLATVHKYCQKLPKDKYAILTPIFDTTEKLVADMTDLPQPVKDQAKESVHQSVVQLPMNCPLKKAIKGQWMPTKRIADKSAALEAVKQLHKCGELNKCLLPCLKKEYYSSDSEGDEDPGVALERKKKHAGTARRSSLYPNKVAPVLSTCLPVNVQNHLYMIMIYKEDTPLNLYYSQRNDPIQTALGILSSKPIPHTMLPEFSLYDGDKTLCVKFQHYHNKVDLAEEELSVLKDSHEAIFSELLFIQESCLHFDFCHANKNYLVVPLKVLSCLHPIECYIDFEQAQLLAGMKNHSSVDSAVKTANWPHPLDDFNNAIIETVHNPEAERQLYHVVSIDQSTTPNSPFPDDKAAATYKEYYSQKYNFHFTDGSQPGLVVKQLGLSETRLRMLVSRFKNHEGEDLQKKENTRDIKLFPSLCRIYPVGSSLWHLVRCLPSALWRFECLLLVDSLRTEVARSTGIGLSHDQSLLVLTKTTLRGYEDHGHGVLDTQEISFKDGQEPEIKPLLEFPHSLLRGPDNALLLQALTPMGAKDSINLERLETLGDSFLKLSTSVFLFCDRPIDHEGKLSISRARRVGNLNLFLLAKHPNKDIVSPLFSACFEPRHMWIPPGFVFREGTSSDVDQVSDKNRVYNYRKITDKGVADAVESLIGAYLVSGGIEAAIRFMKWMGININIKKCTQGISDCHGEHSEHKKDIEGGASNSDCSSYSAPPITKRPKLSGSTSLLLFNSSRVFGLHFGMPQSPQLDHQQCQEVQRLLKICHGSRVSKLLQWTFTEDSLLLQALTHASYSRNRVTDCYQRLEFLGDAVLDYLVTCHIYHSFPKYGPGKISNLRSALVNNVTFAELSVKRGLHTSLLYNSPSLFKQIDDYVRIASCNQKNDKPPIYPYVEELYYSEESVSKLSGTEGESLDSEEIEVDEIDPPKVLGDLLESLAGAVFVDSGCSLESVWQVFHSMFEERIGSYKGSVPGPPQEELMEIAPGAKVKSDKERSRISGRYQCSITITDKGIKIIAEAGNPKTARSAAARAAIRKLNSQS